MTNKINQATNMKVNLVMTNKINQATKYDGGIGDNKQDKPSNQV